MFNNNTYPLKCESINLLINYNQFPCSANILQENRLLADLRRLKDNPAKAGSSVFALYNVLQTVFTNQ